MPEQPISIGVTHPNGSYEVVVSSKLIEKIDQFVPTDSGSPVAIITDTNVGPLLANKVKARFENAVVVSVPAGEVHKRLHTVETIYNEMFEAGCDRNSIALGLGGGVINDMTGFVAATYMRGIRFVGMPTSLLSMVDASVGGKTGVDMPQGKNLIGAFKQPEAVLIDPTHLKSLPADEFACGMAEIIKHGLLSDPALLTEVVVNDWGKLLADMDDPTVSDQFSISPLQKLIVDAIEVKRRVVERDPFERLGERALLNLGHTFGHAIEHVSRYRVKHGQGVAMGLVLAAHLSAKLDFCDDDLQKLIEATLRHVNLPTRVPADLDPEELVQAMFLDKKKKGKTLRFILMKGLGQAFMTAEVELKDVIETFMELQERLT